MDLSATRLRIEIDAIPSLAPGCTVACQRQPSACSCESPAMEGRKGLADVSSL